MQQIENWRPVADVERYEVSDLGRVRNRLTGRMLTPSLTSDGYLVVTLRDHGKNRRHRVHRLVAIAFVSNPKQKPQVNHLDCNKTNNAVANLEWSTALENMIHAVANHRMRQGHPTNPGNRAGRRGANAKLSEDDVRTIRRLVADNPHRGQKGELAAQFGVDRYTIRNLISGRSYRYLRDQACSQ